MDTPASQGSRMKSYATIEVSPDGKWHLPIQLEGAGLGQLHSLLEWRRLEKCRIPKGQAPTMAWRVLLELEGDVHVELSSSSTVVNGWTEYGTVNIAVLQKELQGLDCEWIDLCLPSTFVVGAVAIIRWTGDGLTVDSGLRLESVDGSVLTVVSVDVPGAMRITMPGQVLPVEWQFPVSDYSLVLLPRAG